MSLFIYLLLISITIFPKITIISVNSTATGIRIEDILILICTFLLIMSKIKNRKTENLEFNRVKRILIFYLVICVISTIYGIIKGYVTPVTSILFIVRRLEYFLLCYFGYYYGLKNGSCEGKFINFIVICHTFICLLQLFGLIGSFNHGEMISSLTQGRISSTFNGAYEMSAFLLLLLPYYLYNMISQKKIMKNIFYVLLITFCIIVSASRTSLILEFFVVIYMLLKNRIFKNKKIMQKITVFSLFIVVPVSIFVIPRMDFTRYINLSFNKTSDVVRYAWENKNFAKYVNTRSWFGNSYYTTTKIADMGYDDSLYVRVSHWMQLIDGWIHSPFIGLGVSIAGTACDGNYVKILTETGIFGLMIWLYLLYVIFKQLKYSKWLKYSLITIVIGALLIDLFDASKVMMFFWFILGVFFSRNIQNNEI